MPKGETLSRLSAAEQELVTSARAARALSYSPYSRFSVGAAVRTTDGRLFAGANVENASYGLSICAERSAIIAAVMAGGRELLAVAVCTELSPPASPCGMCRQMLAEFASDCDVLLCGAAPDGEVVRLRLRELLPNAFSPASLRAFAEQQRARGGSDDGPQHGD